MDTKAAGFDTTLKIGQGKGRFVDAEAASFDTTLKNKSGKDRERIGYPE